MLIQPATLHSSTNKHVSSAFRQAGDILGSSDTVVPGHRELVIQGGRMTIKKPTSTSRNVMSGAVMKREAGQGMDFETEWYSKNRVPGGPSER